MTLTTRLAVCGLHLRGQPLNSQLTDLGAKYLKSCGSSPSYRFYAIAGQNGKPTKPGMVFVTDGTGKAIDLELWELEVEKLGFFMLKVPPPLAIGTVQLEDGDSCLGFVCEGHVALSKNGVEDITHLGSWLNYVNK